MEATGLIAELVRQLRPGVHITLQTRETALFSLDTSILNRFAVFATVRACEAAQGRGFTHRVFARVDRDRTYAPAPGEAPFRLDCDGELLVFDEVIIRRGPEWQIVRQPFAGVLGDYEVQHRVWLKRLGDATLVPALSSDAQDFFRGLAIDNHILGSRRRIAIAEAAMPNAIHLSLDGAQVRWAGDIAPEAIADAWNTGAALSVTLADGPDALGPLGGAILRVVAHAPQAQVYADRLAWADGWKRLTAKSLHGSGLSMPLIEGGNPGGAAQERDTTSAARLAAKVHRELDKWMLQRIDAHLGNFLLNEDDPEGAIGLEIAADLRGLMRVTWQGWREAFEDDRALLQRFLRLVASATDEDSDAVQVLVGPRKVNAIICGTALSLAIATVWGQTAPRRARPGNLLRQIAGGERTGHGCAADRIQGQRTIRRAEAHAWETNFVLLALEGTLDLARQAEVAFANVETSQPSLAETTGSGPLIMWITEPLITALGQGTGAVAELLAELERRHAAVLTEAIERQEATV